MSDHPPPKHIKTEILMQSFVCEMMTDLFFLLSWDYYFVLQNVIVNSYGFIMDGSDVSSTNLFQATPSPVRQ